MLGTALTLGTIVIEAGCLLTGIKTVADIPIKLIGKHLETNTRNYDDERYEALSGIIALFSSDCFKDREFKLYGYSYDGNTDVFTFEHNGETVNVTVVFDRKLNHGEIQFECTTDNKELAELIKEHLK